MSQYKISKARLKEIIKEEYEAAMARTDEGHGAFGNANRDEKEENEEKPDFLDLNKNGDKEEPMSKAAAEKAAAEKAADKEEEKDLSKVPPQLRKHMEKKMNKESLDSIRALIQQELKHL